MNDLYIHQLETENKQLREVLKSTNKVVQEYLEKEKYCDELENKIDKAIELFSLLQKKICINHDSIEPCLYMQILNIFKDIKDLLGDEK